MWNIALIKYWCDNYYQLREYELNPFEEIRIFRGELIYSGRRLIDAPYTDTCELNEEFDIAVASLGTSAGIFRAIYLDGLLEPTPESDCIYRRLSELLCRKEG